MAVEEEGRRMIHTEREAIHVWTGLFPNCA
jgi:hypothetical protein